MMSWQARLRQENDNQREAIMVLRAALEKVRKEANECVNKKQGLVLNNTWLNQHITEALTKANCIAERR